MEEQSMNNVLSKYTKYVVLVVLMCVPIFMHLDRLPIAIWDEARLAINAYEMLHDGDFIVVHFDGTPDLWNTKPPLLIWFQVVCMKLLGVNELAVRLPSALAAFFTCISLMIVSLKYLKNFWWGFIAVLILITSPGYIGGHATRTGDYDALLALFTTLSGLLFFAFCETQKYKHLYLFFLFTALAVLTKSVAGLLFLPAIFLYGLIQKQIIPLLKNKHFYIGACCFLFLTIGYYLLREAYAPGYIEAVKYNDIFGRYSEVIEGHRGEFLMYYTHFIDDRLPFVNLLIPCGLMTGFFIKDKRVNKITLFSFLMSIVFFIVISTSETKLPWYDVPLYPFLAILIANFGYYIFNFLQNSSWNNQNFRANVAPFIFLFLIGRGPYQNIINQIYQPENTASYNISYFLKDAVEGKYDLHNQYFLYQGYTANNWFYLNILNDQGVKISRKDFKNLAPMDVAIASQGQVKQYIKKHYKHEVISTVGDVVTYKIYEEKK